MSKKRVHYPVRKNKIAEAIELYNKYNELEDTSSDYAYKIWTTFYGKIEEISPFTHCSIALPGLFQAMEFAGMLTVDNLYNTIICSGINTKLEEYDE